MLILDKCALSSYNIMEQFVLYAEHITFFLFWLVPLIVFVDQLVCAYGLGAIGFSLVGGIGHVGGELVFCWSSATLRHLER